jgi:integrase
MGPAAEAFPWWNPYKPSGGRGKRRATSSDVDRDRPLLAREEVFAKLNARSARRTRRSCSPEQPPPAGRCPAAKAALELDALHSVVLAIPADLRGLRYRARLLVGWTAALRRSELVALKVGDLSFEPVGYTRFKGVDIRLRRLPP